MIIALFSTEYPPFNNTGGIATFMSTLAKHLADTGHAVTVFTDGKNALTRPSVINSVTVVPLLASHSNPLSKALFRNILARCVIKVLKKLAPSSYELLRHNIFVFFTFASYPNHNKFQAAHTPVLFAPAYLLSFIFSSLPVIAHAQGPDELLQPYDLVSWDTKLKARIEASYMKRARFVIPCSQAIRRYLIDVHKYLREKIIYIPNFLDTTLFPAPEGTVNTSTLIFFGRMEKRKGPDLVVKAFAAVANDYPRMKLILLGEDAPSWRVGKRFVTFQDYVKSLKLPASAVRRITFMPRVDERPQLLGVLRQNRGIAILPSRFEPFGFVYIEAMMMGLLTVASTRGAGGEIIENGSEGFVVNPDSGDIASCIRKIRTLSAQELARITLRARRKIILRYDTSRVSNSYDSLYRTLAVRRR